MNNDERLLITLLALLPKDGTPVSVKQLATAANVTQPKVTNVLFDTWFAKAISYDLRTDSYFMNPKVF